MLADLLDPAQVYYLAQEWDWEAVSAQVADPVECLERAFLSTVLLLGCQTLD